VAEGGGLLNRPATPGLPQGVPSLPIFMGQISLPRCIPPHSVLSNHNDLGSKTVAEFRPLARPPQNLSGKRRGNKGGGRGARSAKLAASGLGKPTGEALRRQRGMKEWPDFEKRSGLF
jgi:hypothetical protein